MKNIKYSYDKDGYDENGFTTYNRGAIHRDTGTKYNLEGFDKKGYDKDGYDNKGYNKEGYDREGFNKEGYDNRGFDREGSHKETGTEFNPAGYDKDGYGQDGFNWNTDYDREGYNRKGYDRKGYNREGYDKDGFNKEGFNKEGYDREGFDRKGIHRETGDKYNPEGYDRKGFSREGIYKYAGMEYNSVGRDKEGHNGEGINGITNSTFWDYDKEDFNREGLDERGFNREGIHIITKTKYDIDGYDKDGFNRKGYDEQGYNRKGHHMEGYGDDGFDKNGFDRNGVNSEGINRKTGTKDDRVEFAEEFISYGKSIEAFAKHKQMPVEQVKAIIDEIRTSLIVKEKLDGVLEENANRYFFSVTKEKEQLLTGKISIKEVIGINRVLGLCNPEERKKVTEMLIRGIATHEISVLQYKDILGIKEINSSLPQNIIAQIESLKKSAGPLSRELYKEMDRLKPYRTPYIPGEGEKVGYMEKPTDKKPKMISITNEHRDMARQYLRATGEFICNKTMQATLMKIVKGEIGIEKIQRAQKESELRKLQQEDGELGALIEQSEQFIKDSQGKTQTGPDIDDKGK